MKSPIVVLLNGPPRAGKDSLARMLMAKVPGTQLAKFAAPLKEHCARAWGVSLDWIEQNKDKPFRAGKTFREVLISYSEYHMKSLFGPDVFGELLRDFILANPDVERWVVSDSGFADEAYVLIRAGFDVRLVQVSRPGYDFSGDSRGWLKLPVRTSGVSASNLQELLEHAEWLVEQGVLS